MIRFFPIVFLLILCSCNSKTEIEVIQDDSYGENKEAALEAIELASPRVKKNQIMLLISPDFDYKHKGNVLKLKKYKWGGWLDTNDRYWRELIVDKDVKIEYKDIIFHIEDNKFKFLSISFTSETILLFSYEKVPLLPDE